MNIQQMPRTGKYRMSDCLPDTASDSAYVSHYAYLIAKNPAWLLGLHDGEGRAYYTPSKVVNEKKAA